MPWGHRSIAKAIFGYLKDVSNQEHWKVVYADVKAKTGLGGELYQWAYRYFPAGNKWAVKMLATSQARQMTIEYCDVNIPLLRDVLEREQPDLIVSTYFLHSQTLARMKKRYGYTFALWTVVADPWTPINLSFVEGADKHLVYDDVACDKIVEYGGRKEDVLITGWWTRGELYEKVSEELKTKIREHYHLSSKVPTVFVGGGSLGNNAIVMLLPILITIFSPVQLLFNTGKDETAAKLVGQFKKMISRIPRLSKTMKVECLGWVDNMAEILAVSDVVLGKAGPNFIFDVVACGKPFVAITHIGGQEDGNLELITKKKLGIIRENPIRLARFLRQFLVSPKRFVQKYTPHVMVEREKNRASKVILVEAIKNSLKG